MIDSPIIIIGSGRSGSTVIFEAISHHPDLAWLSQYYYLFGKTAHIGLIHSVLKNIGEKPQGQVVSIFNQIFPRPLEVYPKWAKLCGKQFRYASLHKKSAQEWQIIKTQKFFKQTIKWQGKKRLAIKITGPPRITFLQSIFPNAYFIDIIRHPVSVVNSYLNVNFWKNKGIGNPHWFNFFTKEDYDIWDNYNRSATALAALEWRRIIRMTEIEKMQTNCNYKKVNYEEFLNEPLKIIENIQLFSHLKSSSIVANYIKSKEYVNKNTKVLYNLSNKDISTIQIICENEVKRLGYGLI